jgi:hypothetical protein
MFIKVPATRSKITPVKKNVPAPHNEVATRNIDMAKK